MRYFVLQNSWEVPLFDTWEIQFPYWLHDVLADTRRRKAPVGWNPQDFAFEFRKGPQVDFPGAGLGVHSMSPPMQAALMEVAPNSLEFAPHRIGSCILDNIIDGYAVAIYRECIKAIDKKRSTFSASSHGRLQGGEYVLEHTVLDPKMIKDTPIFRVSGQSHLLVYREDIVQVLKDKQFTGLHFKEIDS